jgi:hypothetical protein
VLAVVLEVTTYVDVLYEVRTKYLNMAMKHFEQDMVRVLREKKNVVMGPAGLGTKNESAGETSRTSPGPTRGVISEPLWLYPGDWEIPAQSGYP